MIKECFQNLARKFFKWSHGDYVREPFLGPNCSHKELRKAATQYSHSETAHYIDRLTENIIDLNPTLEQWEIDQINDFIEKFEAKYNNPLAKAMR